eukprot:m.41592 g.41592  ORF g.41592 m.41592 type:complete len:50 (+) comp7008_c0_seq1:1821-1970(+)
MVQQHLFVNRKEESQVSPPPKKLGGGCLSLKFTVIKSVFLSVFVIIIET